MTFSRMLRKLEPLLPAEVRHWRDSWPHLDHASRQLLEQHVRMEASRRLPRNTLLLPPPPPERARGGLELGSAQYITSRCSFGLEPAEVLQGMGIFGRSGAGKTNVVFVLLDALERAGIPYLFLDWKRTARHRLPNAQGTLRIFTPGRPLAPLAFNPLLPPPGLDRRSYITHVVDLLARAYTLGDGAKNLLQNAIFKTSSPDGQPPTLQDVLAHLRAVTLSGRARGWRETALRALDSLCFADLLHADQAGQSDLAQGFFESSAVVELNGLNTNAKRFLVPALLTWLYHYRLQHPMREQLQLVVVIEEAHHLLYRGDRRSEEDTLSRLMRLFRELGVGFVIVDQHPSLLTSAALGNLYTTVCLNLRDPSDIRVAGALSQLESEEVRDLGKLPVGIGVVKLQDRWQEPFLVRFPLVEVQKGKVSDQDLLRYLRRRTFRPDSLHSRQNHPGIPQRGPGRGVRAGEGVPPSVEGSALLHDVAGHPLDGVAARYRRLGLSAKRGTQLTQELASSGWLKAGLVSLPGSRRLILRPTKAAIRALDLVLPHWDPLESLDHWIWKLHTAARFAQGGYHTEIEAHRPRTARGRADILASRNGQTIAVEIETGKSDVVWNVRQDLRSRVDLVVVLTTTSAAVRPTRQLLMRAGLVPSARIRVERGAQLPAPKALSTWLKRMPSVQDTSREPA